MNIYRFEVKSLRKSTLIWICSMIALAALYLSIYPSMANDAEEFKELLGNYPPAVQAMLGINLDTIASLNGFYIMIFSFILLCGAIQAMNLGVSILSKETRERTADFLLVKPVSRAAVLSAKLCAAFTMLVVTNVVFLLTVVGMAKLFVSEHFDLQLFVLVNFSLFFVQLIFTAIGIVISVFFRKLKSILPVSLGVVFGFYLVGVLLAVGEEGEKLRFLSPFKYFEMDYISKHGGYEISYLVLSAGIILISVAVTYVVYGKKDIHAVS